MGKQKSLEEMRSEVPICLAYASHRVKPNDNFVLARDERITIIIPSKKKERLDVQDDIIPILTPKPRLVILVSTDLKRVSTVINRTRYLQSVHRILSFVAE